MPDASSYWELDDKDIGFVDGQWQPGSFSDEEFTWKPIATYQVPQYASPTRSPIPQAMKEFEGVWLNQKSTSGVTRFEIRPLDDKILVRMWGSCSPDDCYWGEVATTFEDLDDNILQVIWDHGFSVVRSEIQLTSTARIELINHTEYLDDFGRQNRSSHESFLRTSEKPSYEPISSCPPVLGEYDPLDYPYPKSVDLTDDIEPITLPSPAPIHDRYPRPPLYDSFDGDSLDTTIWYVPDEMAQRLDISQANGQLTIASKENPTETHLNYFDFRGFAFETNHDKIVYEAKMRINPTKNSAGQIGLSLITQKGDGLWGLHCALHSSYSQFTAHSKYFWCQANFSQYTSERIPIVIGVWYTLRMELEREYGAFQVYLNGKLVDSFTPLDAELLKSGTFYPKLGVGSIYEFEEESFEAQIDEVYITNP